MTLHAYDITVTGSGRNDIRLTQTVKAPSMGRAAVLACHLVVDAKVSDSAIRLLIERRGA